MSYASRGLGQTIGQSVRRLENQKYAIHCDGWSQRAGHPGRVVNGMRAAMLEAKSVLRSNRNDTCRIFAMPVRGGWMSPGEEVVALRMMPGGQLDVRFNYALEGLGQAKIVPGQISFQTLPSGQTSLPSLEPLVRAGLPIAPYIEHGSWETGQPDIMRYGLDPYRGIMGLGDSGDGLGQGLLASTLCDTAQTRSQVLGALNAGTRAALVGGAIAGVVGSIVSKRAPAYGVMAGAVAGALVGWGTNLVLTATRRAT